MKNLLLLTSLLIPLLSIAGVERIKSLRFDKSEVQTIYLAPGLGSMLTFPCGIEEAFVGRAEDLKAQVSPNDKKVLFLNLKLNTSLPTNLIVRCEKEKSTFVFDIIPQKSKHQDLVEIRSSFGRPKSEELTEIPKKKKRNPVVLKEPTIINEAHL
ncbi:MAG: hypothetical protein LW875_03920 [Proteobacteria bacterium]|nr:hypothetical protein [Pseudomonadota bacterium]